MYVGGGGAAGSGGGDVHDGLRDQGRRTETSLLQSCRLGFGGSVCRRRRGDGGGDGGAAHNRAEPITWGKCGNATILLDEHSEMPVGKFFMAVMSASLVSSPIQGWMNPVHTRMAA